MDAVMIKNQFKIILTDHQFYQHGKNDFGHS